MKSNFCGLSWDKNLNHPNWSKLVQTCLTGPRASVKTEQVDRVTTEGRSWETPPGSPGPRSSGGPSRPRNRHINSRLIKRAAELGGGGHQSFKTNKTKCYKQKEVQTEAVLTFLVKHLNVTDGVKIRVKGQQVWLRVGPIDLFVVLRDVIWDELIHVCSSKDVRITGSVQEGSGSVGYQDTGTKVCFFSEHVDELWSVVEITCRQRLQVTSRLKTKNLIWI